MVIRTTYGVSFEDLPALDEVLLGDIAAVKALKVHHLENGYYLSVRARSDDE